MALIPQALCVVYVSFFIATREVEVGFAAGGQIACELLNFALKRIIKEERPRRIHGLGYGMPSSHSQFVAYWSVYLTLFLLVRHRPSTRGVPFSTADGAGSWSLFERLLLSVAGLAAAGAIAWSRIYLNYHTPRQVMVGVTAGAMFALVWFIFIAIIRQSGLLSWGLETSIARAFRIRDLIVHEDMCQAGWEKWERARLGSGTGINKTK